jgi:hypothetical protein
MSMMETANGTGFRTKSGMTEEDEAKAKGLCKSPEAHSEYRTGIADTNTSRAGAKCFTGEAKVKQESNEFNNLQGVPPPLPPL